MWRGCVERVSCLRSEAAREKFFLYPLWVVFFLVTGAVHYFLWVRPLFFGLDPLHIIEGVLIGVTALSYASAALSDPGCLELPPALVDKRAEEERAAAAAGANAAIELQPQTQTQACVRSDGRGSHWHS